MAASFPLDSVNSSSDLSVVNQRRWNWLTTVTLAVILLFAARARLAWPSVPVSDPDTWGYLHPALAKLNGQGFVHAEGRNFVYPGWLYLLLAGTGDFRAISFAQHFLGLATGGLLWICWRQWRAWIAEPLLPRWTDALLGLGLVAFYEQSMNVIGTEHHIRPEAIFPFFALLDVALMLAFLRAWHVTRQPWLAAAGAGGGLFVAVLLCQLKPSFGFALGITALPVLLALAWPLRWPARPRWLLGGSAGAAVCMAALLFIWPEHRLSRDDAMSTLFLPETLLTIHADIICDQMAADVRDHAATPYPAAWLAETQAALASDLRRSSAPGRRIYPTLGFDPDYLMYDGSSLCARLNAQLGPVKTAAFGFYYYRRAWTHRPLQMMAKIGRQLGVFYSRHCPAFWTAPPSRSDKFFRRSLEPFKFPDRQREMALYPPAQSYLDAIRRLNDAGAHLPATWAAMLDVAPAAAALTLPLLLLFGVGFAISALAWRGVLDAPAAARLLAPGGMILWLHALVFGGVLSVAVVHSLDIPRYSTNLLVFHALALTGSVAWLAELGLALQTRHLSQPSGTDGETPPLDRRRLDDKA